MHLPLNRNNKYNLLLIDIIFGVASFYFAFYLRFDGNIPSPFFAAFQSLFLVYPLFKAASFYIWGVYRRIWKYAGVGDILLIVYALTVSILALVSAGYFLNIVVPRSVFILTWMLDLIVSGGIRVIPKVVKEKGQFFHSNRNAKRLLVVGAGDAGVLVVKELFRQEDPGLVPVGFIDDDLSKQDLRILGLPVLGTRERLKELSKENDIQEVLIAMPSATGQVIREIVEQCREANITVRTLPRMYDIINGHISVDMIREVRLEDLLGREPVKLDLEGIASFIRGKRILITGAGGSIGSELCRQICRYSPGELILLGHDENPVFEIEMELASSYPAIKLSPVIADAKDAPRIDRVFEVHRPEVVFHAAAYKHVPLMEYSPGEAFNNNVLGTKAVAEAADKWGTEKFILISTDKAVKPSSVMGATKRIAEMVIQHIGKTSKTKYAAVRFGNVLGSRGSVIPIFQEQIRRGGPVTITHEEMRRYFMTIPEAVELVLEAASMAEGGEVFILDMGEPVKIVDMAKELIRLSGFEPGKDIAIEFTGIRPGEKLFEEILTDEEGVSVTKHRRIYVTKKCSYDKDKLEEMLRKAGKREHNYQKEQIFEMLFALEKKGSQKADRS